MRCKDILPNGGMFSSFVFVSAILGHLLVGYSVQMLVQVHVNSRMGLAQH